MTIERVALTDDRSAWLRRRLLYCNASEMAIIVGEGGYGSLAELFAEKKGLRPPRLSNATMDRGELAEPSIIKGIIKKRPEWEVLPAKVQVIDHEERIACTPDCFISAPDRPGFGLGQLKTIALSKFRYGGGLLDPDDDIEFGEAIPPAAYVIQTVTERWLNRDRCQWAVLAMLVCGEYAWNLRLFDIEPDPILEEKIVAKSREFLTNYLDANVMPPYEPQRDAELIRHLYPNDDGTEIDLSGDNRALAATEEWLETSAACTRMEKQSKVLRTELAAKLGPHTYARLADGRRLSYKTQHRKAHVVEASDFRVLRVQKSEDSA